MFEDLYDLIARYKVTSLDRFQGISHANRRALSGKIGFYFRDHLAEILTIIEDSQGLVFNFDRFDPKINPVDKIARKALFYSDVSVALLDAQVQFAAKAAHGRAKRQKMPRKVAATNVGPLVETLLEIEPLVRRGILIPLPGSVWFGEDDLAGDLQFRYNNVIAQIRRGELRNLIIPVTLDRWAIRRQIEELESTNERTGSLRPVRLLLPQLRGLQMDTLLRLREDNYDAFSRFQSALREFSSRALAISSETAFLDIARKVDHEVQALERRVRAMEVDRRRHGWDVTLGLAASSLTLLVDAEFAKILAPLFATKTIWDGFQYLRGNTTLASEDDYYMAYLVSKASRGSKLSRFS